MFVAIVDDEIDIANLFRDTLNHLPGVTAFGFSDPILALEHFRINNRNYKCITSDYRMPTMNGIELLGEIKNSDVARMLISAFEIDDKVFCDCDCVDSILQKPIKITELVEIVKRHLNPLAEETKTD